MITRNIESIKNELKNIKFLSKKEVQQITIAVVIAGFVSAVVFSLSDIFLNYIIHLFLFS